MRGAAGRRVPPPTLLASAALAILTGVGFAFVAALALRRWPERGQSAWTMFALFWASAAIIWVTQGLGSLAGYLGYASLPLIAALDQVNNPFYCLAAASLLYYVLYVLTGREKLLVPVLLYYLVVLFFLRLRVETAHRTGIRIEDWGVRFDYATPLQGTAYTLTLAALSGPLLLAILAYGSLWLRAGSRAARYRIALVTTALFGWIGLETISFATGLSGSTAGELTRRLVALASTLVVVAAFEPPPPIRRWLDAAA